MDKRAGSGEKRLLNLIDAVMDVDRRSLSIDLSLLDDEFGAQEGLPG